MVQERRLNCSIGWQDPDEVCSSGRHDVPALPPTIIWLIGCDTRKSQQHLRKCARCKPKGQCAIFCAVLPLATTLTIKMSFTKKPMKPMTTKPKAVRPQILLNSAQQTQRRQPAALHSRSPRRATCSWSHLGLLPTSYTSQNLHLVDQAWCSA